MKEDVTRSNTQITLFCCCTMRRWQTESTTQLRMSLPIAAVATTTTNKRQTASFATNFDSTSSASAATTTNNNKTKKRGLQEQRKVLTTAKRLRDGIVNVHMCNPNQLNSLHGTYQIIVVTNTDKDNISHTKELEKTLTASSSSKQEKLLNIIKRSRVTTIRWRHKLNHV